MPRRPTQSSSIPATATVRGVSRGKAEFVRFVLGRVLGKPSVVPVKGASKPTGYLV